jgi:DGQHR domain-containing protein
MLAVPALRIKQGDNKFLYSFGIDGKKLADVVAISRVKRAEHSTLQGYQRPEVLNHIREIRRYVESSDAMIPNALVIAFDERARFVPAKGSGKGSIVRGELKIPFDLEVEEAKRPGWVVDGQQRLAAIRDARVDEFPIFVTAFITDDEEEQRSQFILVNNTKPLPRGLIHELLPSTEAALPSALQRRRFPAQLMESLNFQESSPFHGRIKSPTNPDGAIKDNSVLRMIENSLQDGALYQHWDPAEGGGDVKAMIDILNAFWAAVAEVFPEAWNQGPRKSRLVHGVGVVSLGLVMDAICDRMRLTGPPSQAAFAGDLEPLAEVCSWTSGYWDFGPDKVRKWNELQNTGKDIQLLANYLLVEYRRRVWEVQGGRAG